MAEVVTATILRWVHQLVFRENFTFSNIVREQSENSTMLAEPPPLPLVCMHPLLCQGHRNGDIQSGGPAPHYQITIKDTEF